MATYWKYWRIVLWAGGAGILLTVLLASPDRDREHPTPALDYSKPIFTKGSTLVCPMDLLLDPNLIEDSPFLALWNRDRKARDAGCLEWRAGVRVFVRPMFQENPKYKDFVQIGVRPDVLSEGFFTITDELTNDVPNDPEVAKLNAAQAARFAASSPPVIDQPRENKQEIQPLERTLSGPPAPKDLNPNANSLDESPSDSPTIAGSSGGNIGDGPPEHGVIGDAEGAFRPGTGGVGYPVCIYCPAPQYSEESHEAKYHGTVVLRAIVQPDGHASNIEVEKDPGLGLRDKAIETVRNWRFKAALDPHGKAVPTVTTINLTFDLN